MSNFIEIKGIGNKVIEIIKKIIKINNKFLQYMHTLTITMINH